MRRNRNFLFFLFVFLLMFLYLSNCGKESSSKAESDTKKEERFKMGQIRKPAVADQFYRAIQWL